MRCSGESASQVSVFINNFHATFLFANFHIRKNVYSDQDEHSDDSTFFASIFQGMDRREMPLWL